MIVHNLIRIRTCFGFYVRSIWQILRKEFWENTFMKNEITILKRYIHSCIGITMGLMLPGL